MDELKELESQAYRQIVIIEQAQMMLRQINQQMIELKNKEPKVIVEPTKG